MEEKKIYVKLITSLFSYGADQRSPELRATELKGAMRYAYRIICPADTRQLAKDEMELFGAASGFEGGTGHISPIRIAMCSGSENNLKKMNENLLLHKKGKQPKNCFINGDILITARLSRPTADILPEFCKSADLDWYHDLIRLSLIICGMGRRSRKGRGCFQIEGLAFETRGQMLEWICRKLNKIAVTSSQQVREPYTVSNGEIVSSYGNHNIRRPLIQKIKIGKRMDSTQISLFLRSVDEACHRLKKGEIKLTQEITGNRGNKFASPLLFRVVQTEEGCYPLYILVKGIRNNREIDSQGIERMQFIQAVEKLQRGDL